MAYINSIYPFFPVQPSLFDLAILSDLIILLTLVIPAEAGHGAPG